MFNFNAEIENILKGENGLGVPVSFMFYKGKATTYVTYMQMTKDAALYGDDEIKGCVVYYDFDIYSKVNYLMVINKLIQLMTAAGWVYTPDRDSPDMYENETGFFHKTISLCKESEV